MKETMSTLCIRKMMHTLILPMLQRPLSWDQSIRDSSMLNQMENQIGCVLKLEGKSPSEWDRSAPGFSHKPPKGMPGMYPPSRSATLQQGFIAADQGEFKLVWLSRLVIFLPFKSCVCRACAAKC